MMPRACRRRNRDDSDSIACLTEEDTTHHTTTTRRRGGVSRRWKPFLPSPRVPHSLGGGGTLLACLLLLPWWVSLTAYLSGGVVVLGLEPLEGQLVHVLRQEGRHAPTALQLMHALASCTTTTMTPPALRVREEATSTQMMIPYATLD